LLLTCTLSGQTLKPLDRFVREPYQTVIDTSLFLNGNFELGGYYWDKPGLQEPVRGALFPYDPEADPGFHTFRIEGHFLEIQPQETVQQRILLSPGLNVVNGSYSIYESAAKGWTPPIPFQEKFLNPHDMHVMETLVLASREEAPTRYTGLSAWCPTRTRTAGQFLARIEAELAFILDLHRHTATWIDPGPDSVFPFPGLHASAKFADFRDLDSITPLFQTMNVPSPHADLYLRAARNGMYEEVAHDHARGVLSSLGKPGDHYLPYRYVFNQEVWVAPGEGTELVPTNLLHFLCDAADHFKDLDFFVAAYVTAKQMIDRNWWKNNTDPEGLFFISNRFEVDAAGNLSGLPIFRTPASAPGASVGEEVQDHRLLLGAAAISRFLRLMHENADHLGYDYLKDPFILECFLALNDSIHSFVLYADHFLLDWIVSLSNPSPLTAAWWTNYDRRDDFMGYNVGLGLVPILLDQSEILGYENLKNEKWVKRLFVYLDTYQVMWDENAKRGGKEASDSYRFYKCFSELRSLEGGKAWSDAYISTYFATLAFCVKGFMFDGPDPEIGTWNIWDFAPYKGFSAKEVTVPGMLFSWAADVYGISRENGSDGTWIVTLMDAVTHTMQQTARGEAGYEKELNQPGIKENGGEFRLAPGLFDMQEALKTYTP
jgi:hypothetical protein